MKKIFLVLIVMILALSSLFAQDDANADEQNGQTENEQTSEESEETIDTVDGISAFSPSFADLRNTDDQALDRSYNLLQTNLGILKDDYLFRILYKANKILEDYTNVTFTDTNEMFYNAVYYYDLVARPIANDNNVDLALRELYKCFRLYDEIKPIYEILGKTNELAQADYELNLYGGILNLFKGSHNYYAVSRDYLTKAVDNINNSGSTNTTNLIMLNTYLAGVNYKLATENQYSDVRKVYYLNEMFNNLWDLTTLKTEDETIRDAKCKLLITKYHKILYTTSERFRGIYSKYYDELGFTYGDTEEEIMGREVLPAYKDDETTDEDSEESSDTENN